MGIHPRTEFTKSNRNILTHIKQDEGRLYVYAYNMQYTEKEAFTFEVKIQGEGKPYRIDCMRGEVEEVGCYRLEDGRTVMEMSLEPGEACLYAIEVACEKELHAVESNADKILVEDGALTAVVSRSGDYMVRLSDGTKRVFSAAVPEEIHIPVWNLEIEDWNEGEKRTIVEDRGLGLVTEEVYYETEKTCIIVGETDLKPWKDIEKAGPAVSGIGYYMTRVILPINWSRETGAVLEIESIHGHTAAVYVNGEKAGVVDADTRKADISGLLRAGENEILVEVTSSLNNRLLARGYYEMAKTYSMSLAANANNANSTASGKREGSGEISSLYDISTVVKDYGMTGDVKLSFYTKYVLDESGVRRK